MKGEANLYERVGLNSDVAVFELEGYEHECNTKMVENMAINTCFLCGKITSPGEVYGYKYCKYCLEVIKSAKSNSYGKCIECNKSLPTSQLYKLKYCPDCAERIHICECCNSEFVFENEDSFICPSCKDNLSKECIKCGKYFIPEESHSYFCSSCYREYTKSMEIQIMESTAYSTKFHKSQNSDSFDFNSLIENLNGNHPVKRALALEKLRSIENKQAWPILISALKNKDTNIRWKTARYLGSYLNKDAVEPLIEALEDEEFIVRNNVVWSLGEIGDKRATKSLNLALKDKNKYVRLSAEEALEKIRYNK